MSLFIASLNSGSNGNCYYIANQKEAVLVDAGISCREIEKRLLRLNLSVKKIKAVFISHEHSDHIRGLEVLAKKYNIPVYITPATLHSGRLSIKSDLTYNLIPFQEVRVGDLSITAFPKYHDAADPLSFNISSNGVCVGVFTDIGSVCDHVISHFKKCNAVFLEANYDEDMLERGNYPYHLKRRIRGGKGHLSNKQALEVFNAYRSENLSHLILSHLSKDNNCPKLVHEIFSHHAGSTKVIVASRYEESSLFHITSPATLKVDAGRPLDSVPVQYSLF